MRYWDKDSEEGFNLYIFEITKERNLFCYFGFDFRTIIVFQASNPENKKMINSKTIFFPNNIEIERVKVPRNFELKNHSHSDFHLCIVVDGSFEELNNSKVVECKKQTVRISKPSAKHEIYFGSEGGECIIIQLNNRFANINNPWFRFNEDSFFSSYSSYIYDFFIDKKISAILPSTLEIELRKSLALCLNNNEVCEPDWLKEVKDVVDSNPSGSFDLRRIAEKVGVHRVHLSRTFSKLMGCTLQEYIILKKLDTAHSFLNESDFNISSVAYEAGFSDHSHFHKIFKRYFNTNPLLYKSKLLSGTHVTSIQENF